MHTASSSAVDPGALAWKCRISIRVACRIPAPPGPAHTGRRPDLHLDPTPPAPHRPRPAAPCQRCWCGQQYPPGVMEAASMRTAGAEPATKAAEGEGQAAGEGLSAGLLPTLLGY